MFQVHAAYPGFDITTSTEPRRGWTTLFFDPRSSTAGARVQFSGLFQAIASSHLVQNVHRTFVAASDGILTLEENATKLKDRISCDTLALQERSNKEGGGELASPAHRLTWADTTEHKMNAIPPPPHHHHYYYYHHRCTKFT